MTELMPRLAEYLAQRKDEITAPGSTPAARAARLRKDWAAIRRVYHCRHDSVIPFSAVPADCPLCFWGSDHQCEYCGTCDDCLAEMNGRLST